MQCLLLLLRITLLPLPSSSKDLNSTSLWAKGMLLWQGFTLSSHQHSHPGAALAWALGADRSPPITEVWELSFGKN